MRIGWVAPLVAPAVAAPAAARSEQRYICANDINVERAPVNGPIGVAFRGERFVATRFARHGTWARGTAFGFALERRPVKRAVGCVGQRYSG
jgi:hypothetical protein